MTQTIQNSDWQRALPNLRPYLNLTLAKEYDDNRSFA